MLRASVTLSLFTAVSVWLAACTVPPVCGDAVCNDSCPSDCPPVCGDLVCNGSETNASCPVDCLPSCGDAVCNGMETNASCPSDCPPICGDTVCNGTETNATCATDCLPVCGDAVCNGDETNASCPSDCPPICGDAVCNGVETNATCPSDCPPLCGDTVCNGLETNASCPEDCPPICGDTVCNGSETNATCPADCPPVCGDAVCNGTEIIATCPVDCPPVCGDLICSETETNANCPGDCRLTNVMLATNVLGQPDFASKTCSTTQSGMSVPRTSAFDAVNQRLFVPDTDNNRVLVYDAVAFANGEPAVNVLGQPDFVSSTRAATQSGMWYPHGVAYDTTHQRLFVVDDANNRVLVYDVAAITDGEPAINVLGQPDFTSSGYARTQTGMHYPFGVTYDETNQRLFVGDGENNRVLVYDVATITDGEPAINVIGQPNFTSGGSAATQTGMYYPYDVSYDAIRQRLFVADTNHNRVLVYDVAAITDGEPAINVLGQTGFTTSGPARTMTGMNSPRGVAYDATNQRLFVADFNNSYVLVYDVAVITDGEPAANFLGNVPGTNQRAMAYPWGVTYDTTYRRLFVADFGNCRTLVFDP